LKNKKHNSDKSLAVSPVIGVMLMLTLTLLIAAIVSSLAGGIVKQESKAPSLTLRATYHQTGNLSIEHMGGDPVSTRSTLIILRPSKTFGQADYLISILDPSRILDGYGNSWKEITVFRPGETAYVEGQYLQPGIDPEYWFNASENEGKTFFLEMTDQSRKIFARTEVLIEK